VEPYVVAADIYSRPPHVGRGGWTWYTGSAAWLYRAGLENLLGFQRRGDRLRIDPCIPAAWKGFTITYRHGPSRYAITVDNSRGVERGVAAVRLDGVAVSDGVVTLMEDGKTHEVRVEMGAE
jgi:cyclic beta-1,2-glucan synthetase